MSNIAPYEPTLRRDMLEFVPCDAKRILEIGCGRSLFARELKARQDCEVIAIEPDPVMAGEARRYRDQIIVGSVEEILPALASDFDCIVMNDVVEHLVDPWSVLRALRTKLASGGRVVVSIPNMRFHRALKGLVLYREWEYQKSGVLDRTHLRFFTDRSIVNLFESQGYCVERLVGINAERLPWKVALLNRLLGGALSDTQFPQFACVARVQKTECT